MKNRYMLNRTKATLLVKASVSKDSLFSNVPPDVTRLITNTLVSDQRDHDFLEALEDAAFGRLKELKSKLDANPSLVFQRGNVITPAGLEVEETTLLECAIGGGDPEMVAMIKPYFQVVAEGEKEMESQLKRYRLVIDGMINELDQVEKNKLDTLISIIKGSSDADVTAALEEKNEAPDSQLKNALREFRKDVTPTEMTKPGMHYHYQRLIYAFNLLEREWDALSNNGNNYIFKLSAFNLLDGDSDAFIKNKNRYNKCELVWRQVIGFLQRGLPAVDRFAFSQGLNRLVKNHEPLVRNTDSNNAKGRFWDTLNSDADFTGLGFDYSIYGCTGRGNAEALNTLLADGAAARIYKLYVKKKHQTYEALCNHTQQRTLGV